LQQAAVEQDTEKLRELITAAFDRGESPDAES
jgi:hypothetical protein